MTIGKLSGQCDFGQKGQSYCNQRGQSCVAKRVKVAWLFQLNLSLKNTGLFKTAFSNLTLIDLRIVIFLHWIWNNYDAIWRLAKSALEMWQIRFA